MLLGVDVMVDILIVDMMDVLPQIGVRTIICGKLRAKTRDLRIDGAAYVLSLRLSLTLSLSLNTQSLYYTAYVDTASTCWKM